MLVDNSFDYLWILVCSFLVMSMQIGFCMLESGFVRAKNVINVAFKNVMDFVTACLVFWAVGFGLMYGASAAGILGTSHFLVQHGDVNGAFLIFQMMFCGTAATLIGGALAERARFSVFIMISVMVAAFVYPIAGHWAWAGADTGASFGWLNQLGFIDFAGSSVVHGVGGWFALAAVIVVGARIGRFDPEKPAIRGGNYPVATAGVLVLWFGWFGFNGGSGLIFNSSVSAILLNTSLAAASGGATLVGLAWLRDRKPNIGASLNGVLSGLVGVTAGAHIFSTTDAVIVGCLSACVCAFVTNKLADFKIDDVLGAFPVHGAAGFLGTLLVAVLGDSSAFPQGHSALHQLGIQALGASAIAAWAFGAGFIGLTLLSKVMPLRVTAEEEIQGLNGAEHGASTDLVDLLTDMHLKGEQGEFSGAVEVEPHTEVGQIATEYNRVLARVREEIETREEAWRQLKEATNFQFIFDNTHEGIVQLSLKGEILESNPAAISLMGFETKQQLMENAGNWLQDSLFSDEALRTQVVGELDRTNLVKEQEVDFRRYLDGKPGHVSASLRLVEGNEDRSACYIVSLIDIQDRRDNERLRVEKDAAEAASDAKSSFLANMSHEIRTPLNGVTGMIELLTRTELTSQQSRYTDIAATSAQALLGVINNVLDVSKIEAGKLELENAEFDLHDTLADVADMFAPQAASKNLEIINAISPNIPARVIGDGERLRQVLINLLNNAIKFTETGSVALESQVKASLEGAVHLQMVVRDTGCGIPQSAIESLFDAFTQADISTTRQYGGTGLGLTICRQLIELMRGHIRVESKLGEGTQFIIDLVLPVGDADANTPKGYLEDSHAGKRILAVDDHPANLTLVCDLLTPYGINVATAEDGKSALAVIEKAHSIGQPFDLMLLDFHMPGMDGAGLARAVRLNGDYDPMNIIMLTSVDQAISVDEQEKLGISSSITKPLRASRFFDALNVVLGKSSSRATMNASAPKKIEGEQTKAQSTDQDRSQRTGQTTSQTTTQTTSQSTSQTTSQKTAQNTAQSSEPRAANADSRNTAPETTVNVENDAQPTEAPNAELTSGSILLVEDNLVNQMVAEGLLEDLGYEVTTTSNGEEAIEQLQAQVFDVVLMDCQMPVLDGFAATEKWRQIEQENNLPRTFIIALTANAIKGDRERCLEAGMDEYITKPIDVDLLKKVLAAHLSQRAA